MKAKRKRKSVSVKAMPYIGDHGTGTAAATAGTVLEPATDKPSDPNPNNVGRRRRRSEIDRLAPKLTMRQEQAARAISNAYCRVQMLSSGGELREQVDSSSKPDACITAQVSAQSDLAYVMTGVPQAPVECRQAIEQVCWHGEPIGRLASGRAHEKYMTCLKVALNAVADHMRY
jgi:hypothetical protein